LARELAARRQGNHCHHHPQRRGHLRIHIRLSAPVPGGGVSSWVAARLACMSTATSRLPV
jgi:hypothetical protein